MAIFAVALIATIASAIVAEHGAAIGQLSGRADQAQARWLARGAVDWARNVLQFDKIRGNALPTGNVDHLGEEWAITVPPMPIDEGQLSGKIQELSSRFNLNNLVSQGTVDPTQQAIFLRLLANLDIPAAQANALCDAIIDWIDPDEKPRPNGAETDWYSSHQQTILPPQAPLLSVDELLAVRGFTPALLDRLRPNVSALPQNADGINVNIAPAVVLSAYIDGLPLAEASNLTRARDQALSRHQIPYASVQDFIDSLSAVPKLYAQQHKNLLDVQSYYFQVTGGAHWGDATTHMEVLLHRDQSQSTARPDIIRETIL